MSLKDLAIEDKPMRLIKAAEYLGICQKTLKRAAERGRLKIFKIGGRWFVLPSEMVAYFKRQQKRSFS